MLVALQLVGVAAVPLNLTVLVPCVAPKFVPVIVTDVPTGPDVGANVVMLGAAPHRERRPVARHPAYRHHHVARRRSRSAPALRCSSHSSSSASPAVPLNFTVLVPCVAPKFVPVIVTDVPTGPDVGANVVMLGAAPHRERHSVARHPAYRHHHVSRRRSRSAPAPRCSSHPSSSASPAVPLNFTVLVPCVAPKFVPVIVTDVPTGPDVGDQFRDARCGTATVNVDSVARHSAHRHHHVPVVAPARHRHHDARRTPARRRRLPSR